MLYICLRSPCINNSATIQQTAFAWTVHCIEEFWMAKFFGTPHFISCPNKLQSSTFPKSLCQLMPFPILFAGDSGSVPVACIAEFLGVFCSCGPERCTKFRSAISETSTVLRDKVSSAVTDFILSFCESRFIQFSRSCSTVSFNNITSAFGRLIEVFSVC